MSPLIIGSMFWLDPPMPLQWKTIEVCVNALKTDESTGNIATIEAAPIVVVIETGTKDNVTSIAAIVGYSTTDKLQLMDTFDSASLRESLSGISSAPYYKDTTKVRLLCIGRAQLFDFCTVGGVKNDQQANDFSQMPNDNFAPNVDNQKSIMATGITAADPSRTNSDGFKATFIDEQLTPKSADSVTSEPIVMAHMKLVLDTPMVRETDKSNEFGSFSSPVHALSQLSMWTGRIGFVHNNRRKLAQGIQAAQTRLDMLSQEWEDHDGIGNIYSGVKETNAMDLQTKINNMLRLTEEIKQDSAGDPSTAQISHSKILSKAAARIFELDNFALGSTPSA